MTPVGKTNKWLKVSSQLKSMADNELANRQSQKDTYTKIMPKPSELPKEKATQLSDYLLSFRQSWDSGKGEKILQMYPIVKGYYDFFVPDEIEEREFWLRYGWRCDRNRILKDFESLPREEFAKLVEMASDQSEEKEKRVYALPKKKTTNLPPELKSPSSDVSKKAPVYNKDVLLKKTRASRTKSNPQQTSASASAPVYDRKALLKSKRSLSENAGKPDHPSSKKNDPQLDQETLLKKTATKSKSTGDTKATGSNTAEVSKSIPSENTKGASIYSNVLKKSKLHIDSETNISELKQTGLQHLVDKKAAAQRPADFLPSSQTDNQSTTKSPAKVKNGSTGSRFGRPDRGNVTARPDDWIGSPSSATRSWKMKAKASTVPPALDLETKIERPTDGNSVAKEYEAAIASTTEIVRPAGEISESKSRMKRNEPKTDAIASPQVSGKTGAAKTVSALSAETAKVQSEARSEAKVLETEEERKDRTQDDKSRAYTTVATAPPVVDGDGGQRTADELIDNEIKLKPSNVIAPVDAVQSSPGVTEDAVDIAESGSDEIVDATLDEAKYLVKAPAKTVGIFKGEPEIDARASTSKTVDCSLTGADRETNEDTIATPSSPTVEETLAENQGVENGISMMFSRESSTASGIQSKPMVRNENLFDTEAVTVDGFEEQKRDDVVANAILPITPGRPLMEYVDMVANEETSEDRSAIKSAHGGSTVQDQETAHSDLPRPIVDRAHLDGNNTNSSDSKVVDIDGADNGTDAIEPTSTESPFVERVDNEERNQARDNLPSKHDVGKAQGEDLVDANVTKPVPGEVHQNDEDSVHEAEEGTCVDANSSDQLRGFSSADTEQNLGEKVEIKAASERGIGEAQHQQIVESSPDELHSVDGSNENATNDSATGGDGAENRFSPVIVDVASIHSDYEPQTNAAAESEPSTPIREEKPAEDDFPGNSKEPTAAAGDGETDEFTEAEPEASPIASSVATETLIEDKSTPISAVCDEAVASKIYHAETRSRESDCCRNKEMLLSPNEEATSSVHAGQKEVPQWKLVVLLSASSNTLQQRANQDRSITILNGAKIPFETVDASEGGNKDRRNALFEISGIRGNYPQFFIVVNDTETRSIGDFACFESMNDRGQLAETLATFASANAEQKVEAESNEKESAAVFIEPTRETSSIPEVGDKSSASTDKEGIISRLHDTFLSPGTLRQISNLLDKKSASKKQMQEKIPPPKLNDESEVLKESDFKVVSPQVANEDKSIRKRSNEFMKLVSNVIFTPNTHEKSLSMEKEAQRALLKEKMRELDLGLEKVLDVQLETQDMLVQQALQESHPSAPTDILGQASKILLNPEALNRNEDMSREEQKKLVTEKLEEIGLSFLGDEDDKVHDEDLSLPKLEEKNTEQNEDKSNTETAFKEAVGTPVSQVNVFGLFRQKLSSFSIGQSRSSLEEEKARQLEILRAKLEEEQIDTSMRSQRKLLEQKSSLVPSQESLISFPEENEDETGPQESGVPVLLEEVVTSAASNQASVVQIQEGLHAERSDNVHHILDIAKTDIPDEEDDIISDEEGADDDLVLGQVESEGCCSIQENSGQPSARKSVKVNGEAPAADIVTDDDAESPGGAPHEIIDNEAGASDLIIVEDGMKTAGKQASGESGIGLMSKAMEKIDRNVLRDTAGDHADGDEGKCSSLENLNHLEDVHASNVSDFTEQIEDAMICEKEFELASEGRTAQEKGSEFDQQSQDFPGDNNSNFKSLHSMECAGQVKAGKFNPEQVDKSSDNTPNVNKQSTDSSKVGNTLVAKGVSGVGAAIDVPAEADKIDPKEVDETTSETEASEVGDTLVDDNIAGVEAATDGRREVDTVHHGNVDDNSDETPNRNMYSTVASKVGDILVEQDVSVVEAAMDGHGEVDDVDPATSDETLSGSMQPTDARTIGDTLVDQDISGAETGMDGPGEVDKTNPATLDEAPSGSMQPTDASRVGDTLVEDDIAGADSAIDGPGRTDKLDAGAIDEAPGGDAQLTDASKVGGTLIGPNIAGVEVVIDGPGEQDEPDMQEKFVDSMEEGEEKEGEEIVETDSDEKSHEESTINEEMLGGSDFEDKDMDKVASGETRKGSTSCIDEGNAVAVDDVIEDEISAEGGKRTGCNESEGNVDKSFAARLEAVEAASSPSADREDNTSVVDKKSDSVLGSETDDHVAEDETVNQALQESAGAEIELEKGNSLAVEQPDDAIVDKSIHEDETADGNIDAGDVDQKNEPMDRPPDMSSSDVSNGAIEAQGTAKENTFDEDLKTEEKTIENPVPDRVDESNDPSLEMKKPEDVLVDNSKEAEDHPVGKSQESFQLEENPGIGDGQINASNLESTDDAKPFDVDDSGRAPRGEEEDTTNVSAQRSLEEAIVAENVQRTLDSEHSVSDADVVEGALVSDGYIGLNTSNCVGQTDDVHAGTLSTPRNDISAESVDETKAVHVVSTVDEAEPAGQNKNANDERRLEAEGSGNPTTDDGMPTSDLSVEDKAGEPSRDANVGGNPTTNDWMHTSDQSEESNADEASRDANAEGSSTTDVWMLTSDQSEDDSADKPFRDANAQGISTNDNGIPTSNLSGEDNADKPSRNANADGNPTSDVGLPTSDLSGEENPKQPSRDENAEGKTTTDDGMPTGDQSGEDIVDESSRDENAAGISTTNDGMPVSDLSGEDNADERSRDANTDGDSTTQDEMPVRGLSGEDNVDERFRDANAERYSATDDGISSDLSGEDNVDEPSRDANAKGNSTTDDGKPVSDLSGEDNVDGPSRDANAEGNPTTNDGMPVSDLSGIDNVHEPSRDANADGNSTTDDGMPVSDLSGEDNVDEPFRDANAEGNSTTDDGMPTSDLSGEDNVDEPSRDANTEGNAATEPSRDAIVQCESLAPGNEINGLETVNPNNDASLPPAKDAMTAAKAQSMDAMIEESLNHTLGEPTKMGTEETFAQSTAVSNQPLSVLEQIPATAEDGNVTDSPIDDSPQKTKPRMTREEREQKRRRVKSKLYQLEATLQLALAAYNRKQ